MKPKPLLITNLETHLAPAMETLGFKFLRSGIIRFRRYVGEFEQQVDFLPSYNNEENYCNFQCGFMIHSAAFAKWLVESGFTDDEEDGLVCAGGEMTIPDWPRKKPSLSLKPGSTVVHRFRFTNANRDKREVAKLKKAITGPTVAYLDQLSDWKSLLSARHSKMKWHLMNAERRCLAQFMLGRHKQAKRTLEAELRLMVRNGQSDFPQMHWHCDLYSKMFGEAPPHTL